MSHKEDKTYKVQSDNDKNKWHKVVIKPWGRCQHIPECDCPDHIYRRKVCEHIERAISCLNHGQ